MKVNFYLDVGELTRKTLAKRLRTLANRPKTMANESLAKRLVGETTAIPCIHITNRETHSIGKYICCNDMSVDIFVTVLYFYNNRRVHKNTNTFAVFHPYKETISSPIQVSMQVRLLIFESFFQEIKMAILTFQITKDGSSFDTASNIQITF